MKALPEVPPLPWHRMNIVGGHRIKQVGDRASAAGAYAFDEVALEL
ncbi:hypothetical protein [Sinorhizobium medicae]|nr:hypothetical protein [Sinorhizobium medicae]MBO1965646.1 hypothetical protein [Sinorhizobium medicae]WQO55284.1 hypothetical protein U8C36_21015 [Sinorhizobium medicae]WQP41316.1 hypothetical protein U8C38_28655 [Sinorhizobium medicae]